MSSKLEDQIATARRTIQSDGYPISIGELTNMYKEGELKIRPEFQRFFRWKDEQKSRLIESIILGIPIPSIFVAQGEDGAWEVVDGLQRLSTIFQFQGELLAERGVKAPPLILTGTEYLPALEGVTWTSGDKSKELSTAQRLDIKRSKIDVKIIKRSSSARAKYDLFRRLNSYGSSLTAQELRSALVVSISSKVFEWIEKLSQHESFIECTLLSERLIDERYDLELVTRFLFLHDRPIEKINTNTLRDLSKVLDEESVKFAERPGRLLSKYESTFKKTFDHIYAGGGFDVLRKWDPEKDAFSGSFLNTSFEIFALGIAYNIANNVKCRKNLIPIAKKVWGLPDLKSGFSTGRSTEARLAKFIPLGRKETSVP